MNMNLEKITDEELVNKIKKDKNLYEELVDRYQTKLSRYINYLIHDEDVALDVVQNTFIKAYVNLNGFDTNKKFSSWIYRIAHNESMNVIKKNKKEIRIDENFDIPEDSNIEEEFDKKEMSKIVGVCIKKLPEKYSEVLILYFLDDKSYEEISDILRIPVGTVGIRIKRGKEMMKKICPR